MALGPSWWTTPGGVPKPPYTAHPVYWPKPQPTHKIPYTATPAYAPKRRYDDSWTLLRRALPGLEADARCPVHPAVEGRPRPKCWGMVADVVIHLNDGLLWTREQIADWLETLDVDLTFSGHDDPEDLDDPGR